jgi:hypothetical protein
MLPTDSSPYLEAFDVIVNGISGADQAFSKIRRRITERPTLIDDPKSLQRIFRDELTGNAFAWPLFDKWHSHFLNLGEWPYMWKGPDADRIELLQNLMLLGRRRAFPGDLVRFSLALSDEPSAVIELITSKIDDYSQGIGDGLLPPFFPGDRTRAIPGLKSRRDARDGVVVCQLWGTGNCFRN